MSRSPPKPGSPNPHAPTFRPSPARAVSLTTAFPYKSRALSQPAGERSPAPGSKPESGRGSPGYVNASAFGVIGGSRTPGRFGNSLTPGGATTRANSFSAGEIRDPRNRSSSRTLPSHAEEHPSGSNSTSSPFPTFSPNSSPGTSPGRHDRSLAHHHSPPKAGANVSRSRSQSLAAGVRPIGQDRPHVIPMSTLENTGAFARSVEQGWSVSPPDASNMSPFTRGLPTLVGTGAAGDDSGYRNGISQPAQHRFRSPTDQVLGGRAAWGSSAPETVSSALSSSVAKALGGYNQPAYSTIVGGFGDSTTNGGKSGSSSRRHSISAVGGRRDFLFGDPGQGMSSMTSPPGRGLGPLGFTDLELLPERLGNMLNLEVDQSRKHGPETEGGKIVGRDIPYRPQKVPPLDPLGETSHPRNTIFPRERENPFPTPLSMTGSSPARGRPISESNNKSEWGRFGTETLQPSGTAKLSGQGSTFGAQTSPFPDRGRDHGAVGPVGAGIPRGGPGTIGGPAMFDPRMVGHQTYQSGPLPIHPQQGNIYSSSRPSGFSSGAIGAGPPSPTFPTHPPLGRPPPGVADYYGSPRSSMPGQHFNSGPSFSPPHGAHNYAPSYFSPPPSSPHHAASPSSFSSLSLADLGKGIPLVTLAPTTPLYIVAFKAGRRDVYYCPDPTLLISNGDRVIVEADRGSDLGTVVYDQLTPVDVREWQEKQATAALLSGASQHQPPGMVVANSQNKARPRVSSSNGELSGVDLHTLLAGVGPSGQPDMVMTQSRGPLAKEVMPKRIFAKSSQGPEEQARMLEKLKDEYEAMIICREKVEQRGLPMQIVDAEYQWDRRKLTFYFKAEKRVDFRDLTKENFRIFKSRIWMSIVPKDDPRSG